MKVRCINESGWTWIRRKKSWWRKNKQVTNGPKQNDIVTVENEYWYEGKQYYILLEWPMADGSGWDAKGFEPIEEQYESVSFEKIKEKASIN